MTQPQVIVAARSRQVVESITSCFDAGIPLVLLHPKEHPEEHAARLARLEGVVLPDGTAAVLFTSGSSGDPKAVILSRRAFEAAARASAANLGWRADDRWLCSLPLSHIGGLSIITRCHLGGRPAVCDPHPAFDPERTAHLIASHRITLWSAVPAMIDAILEQEWDPPAHLRAILVSGARIPPSLLARARGRGLPLLTCYGMTETCAQVCAQPCGTLPDPDWGGGLPLPGVEVRIGDDQRIEIRSPTLMTGYAGAAASIQNGWLTTSDRGRIGERGQLFVLGRADDTIISGGENVDPAAVEPVLERFAGVRAACVFGINDRRWGQLVAAAVVASEVLDRAALARHLAAHLASHARPRRLAVLDTLCLGAGGKIDRAATAARARPHLAPL